MGFRIGQGYLGNPSLQTSTANKEVLPNPPVGWTGKYNCYKFSFDNDQPCTVKINNGSPIYLRGGQGFETKKEDAPIWSFIIVEAGITYNFVAAY